MGRLGRGLRLFGAALAAGVLTGAVVGGLGSRLVMRIIAVGNRSHYGETTHDNAVVGVTTLDGTLNLVTQGVAAGVIGALFYLLCRRWLPGRGWRKGLGFGVVLLAATYPAAIDVEMYEFFRYIRPVYAYALFAVLFVAYGVAAAPLTERWGRGSQEPPGNLVVRWVGRIALLAFVTLGVLDVVEKLRSVGSPLL